MTVSKPLMYARTQIYKTQIAGNLISNSGLFQVLLIMNGYVIEERYSIPS
jgi:hypothetical protein